MDNSSSHRGQRSLGRLQSRYSNLGTWRIEPFAGHSVQPLVNSSDFPKPNPDR